MASHAIVVALAGSAFTGKKFRVESCGKKRSRMCLAVSWEQHRAAPLSGRFSARFKQILSAAGPESGSRKLDQLPLRYDPNAIASYFQRRPLEVIARVLDVVNQCSFFIASIILDKSLGKLRENEGIRAVELVKLITTLGPTAIKIGQALSIRPDMVSTLYLEQLQKLQDRVPPFPNEVAMQMIKDQIGDNVFDEISSEPIAAGSLGQVYKARLKSTGDAVAVKVQRPGVLQLISCDLLILRHTTGILQSMFKFHTDVVDLLDSWAVRFFDELDYFKEACNAQRFTKNMSSVPMVVIPKVYIEFTSGQVLTTKWIDGEKLSEIREKNVLLLVKTALTCYLIQLLESGFLHADPHPGNLLRTPDGRLCILDYGLMTEVTEDRQLAMIEYLAHVMNCDYEGVAEDLVRLGFLPSQTDPEMTVAIVPEVARIFSELVRGGGARKVNMQEISVGITKISKDYTLVVPSYFSLIIRAFTLLEGIGLEIDPDYAIIRECYPYVAKRLITDESSRVRNVLKYFLYSETNQLNVKRLEYIIGSFQDFQRLMSPEKKSAVYGSINDSADNFTTQALFLLLDPKGSFIQELVLAEFVRLVDALSRTARLQLWQFFAGALGLPTPSFISGAIHLSQEDKNSLETLQRLWPLLQSSLLSQKSGAGLITLARQIIETMPDIYHRSFIFSQKFLIMLLQRQALRYSDELTGKRSGLVEWDKDPASLVRRLPWT